LRLKRRIHRDVRNVVQRLVGAVDGAVVVIPGKGRDEEVVVGLDKAREHSQLYEGALAVRFIRPSRDELPRVAVASILLHPRVAGNNATVGIIGREPELSD
nr:hypothetical protein [Tanacetum cinerariifolium]